MAERKTVAPVKLRKLQTLANEHKIHLKMRNMGGYKEVHVTRGNLKEYQWRKLIQRLKAAGFELSVGEWYCPLKNGKWLTGPYGENPISA